jgi:selenide,water dikinase
MSKASLSKTLVLVGGGHAHVHVLKRLAAEPEPSTRSVLIARDRQTVYSGMLPGHIQGYYDYETCHIDLRPLAQAAGVELIHAEAVGLDPGRRIVLLRDRPPVAYDVVSLDIGSTPDLGAAGAREHALPVKPVEPFLEGWRAIVAEVERTGAVPRIAIVGGGIGGVESSLAIHARLAQACRKAGRDGASIPLTLVTRGELLDRTNALARRMLRRELARRRIAVATDAEVVRVEDGALATQDGRTVAYDHVFWITWASAAPWLRGTGLTLDERGFVAVDATLRSVSHPEVFAAGDVATALPHRRPKAGVFAVRQGPPLAENLRRALRGEPPRPFTPQRRALALVGTGDRRAVAVWGPLALSGAPVWRWKEWIDRRWMRQYQPPLAD